MGLEKLLHELGLEEREAKLYLALLELGESTVLPIAKKARIQRTYCYDILDALSQQGLVSFVERNGRRRYSAADPNQLKTLLEQRLANLNAALPELAAIVNQRPDKPKVQFYEGKDGLLAIYEQLPKIKTFYAIASPDQLYDTFGTYFDQLAARAVNNKVRIRELLTETDRRATFVDLYDPTLQQVRHLPKGMKLDTDLLIFENKLVLISYEPDIHAVVIESESIVKTHRHLFELLWQHAKEK